MKLTLNLIYLGLWILFNVSTNVIATEIVEQCKVDCACCKDKVCGPGQWFSDECTVGCIDGYTGARCYKKCPGNCMKCNQNPGTCLICQDGYYNISNNCTSKCLPGCKTCTSDTACTSCKEGYYNDNGHNDCRYQSCPERCHCENPGQCTSCKTGYYDTSNSCNSFCPSNCLTCVSQTECGSCKDGFYNNYQNGIYNNCPNQCTDNCAQCSSLDSCSLCKTGFYGTKCENKCSIGCTGNTCNTNNGNCDCSSNFAGGKCDECQTGIYGNMCDQQCPVGCNGKVCEKYSGNCTEGCITDKMVGNKCDSCSTGWYGQNCNIPCSVGCKNLQCERTDGECSLRCQGNFVGGKCDQCKPGKYGETCKNDCPINCDDSGCFKQTGNCRNCIKNFHGDKCDQCAVGYSGDKCCINNNNCISCLSDTKCKQCMSGYFSDQCDRQCPNNCLSSCNIDTGHCDACKGGHYGDRCNISCPSNCGVKTTADGSICQQKGGECLYGCVDGFHGSRCSFNCSIHCNDTLCNQEDGICTKGCQKRIKNDPFCPLKSELKQKDYQDDDDGGSLIGPIVGSVAAVLVATVVVIGVIIFCRRRQGNKGQGQHSDLENTHLAREAEQNHTHGNIAVKPASKAEKERKSAINLPPSSEDVKDTHQNPGKKSRAPTSVTSPSVDVDDVEINEVKYENKTDDTYYNIRESPYRIKVENLLKYVTSGKVDFEAEFKKLAKDLNLTKHCSVAKDPQNLPLNRYNGIYPYDHSRVTIPEVPDFFINACYIDGYRKEKEYIASLGPTSKTTANFSSFWLMVWYKKTDIIVMLTNLRETSGMKCEQYWPEVETEAVYGDIKVKCRSIEEFAEYTVRTCTISKDKEERQIIQLHFTAWPDKGVPNEVTSLVEFRQRVKAVPKVLGGPIIVHCSAGIGRTGTYIGLDILTQEGQEKGSVDVFRCVNKMRSQRVQMVQTHAQYQFLHKALVHSLTFGCETLSAEEIQKMMYEADDSTFMKIYKTLSQEVDIEHEDDMNAREDNKKRYKEKNRRQSNVPCDSSRVRLYLARQEGKHDYINAVFINSFRTKNLFIAAQTPLPKTIEDFLSMVFQQPTCCIVALENQSATGKDVGQYLPADNETYTFGNFAVTSSKYETKSQYILKKLTVKDYSKDQKKTVLHFQYTKWHAGRKVPDSAKDFVQFIKEVETCVNNDKEEDPNIIAHCLNGFERSGLFCIVYKLLEKLEAERQVSVVNVVRKIRTHRSQSITCMEQLKFCYECVSAYLEVYNTYSNFAT